MTLREYADELTFPARSASEAITLVVFYLLLLLAEAAGLLGLWLAIVVYVGLFRHLTMLAVARARGRDAPTPDIEYFTVSNLWNVLPGLLVILVAAWANVVGESWGAIAALWVGLAAALLLPAVFAVLVITQSATAMLDPRALATLVSACGIGYLYAPFTAVLVVLVPMQLDWLPNWASLFVEIYLLAALFAVIGAITRAERLVDAVDIPAPAERDPAETTASLERRRKGVLDHAYGFASRDNLASALDHIADAIGRDPEPGGAARWYFERMLEWENRDPALFYAQRYLSRLLAQNERVAAVKLMLRARLENERFRPLPEDLPAAIEAAEDTGNEGLADALRRL